MEAKLVVESNGETRWAVDAANEQRLEIASKPKRSATAMAPRHDAFIPLVLAGGSGKRLSHVAEMFEGEPLPKQFCRFGRGHSLLQQTLARFLTFSPDGIHLVVNRDHVERAWDQARAFENPKIVEQPGDRGTAVGVLLGLLSVLRENPLAVVALTPSDHAFRHPEVFRESLRVAVSCVREGEAEIIVLGAPADSARTDFGWIIPGQPISGASTPLLTTIEKFVEKPPETEARRMQERGGLWSTMVTVCRGHSLLRRFQELLPELTQRLIETELVPDALEQCYLELEQADFSRDVLGDGRGLATLPWGDAGWVDLGLPERLFSWLREQEREGEALQIQSSSLRSIHPRNHLEGALRRRVSCFVESDYNRASTSLLDACELRRRHEESKALWQRFDNPGD